MTESEEPEPSRPWMRGAVISAVGALIGLISLLWFCHALGLNFRDEGWAEDGRQWQANRPALIGSLVGFAVAILVFWLGFFQTTNSRS